MTVESSFGCSVASPFGGGGSSIATKEYCFCCLILAH